MALRKPEKALPMLPAQTRIQCAAQDECQLAGRMWLRTLPHDKRVCVNHYYAALEQDRSLARDPTVPPKEKVSA